MESETEVTGPTMHQQEGNEGKDKSAAVMVNGWGVNLDRDKRFGKRDVQTDRLATPRINAGVVGSVSSKGGPTILSGAEQGD